MSNALVIKNVNFYANKLDTISIVDQKPCTGITLDSDTMTFTSEGQEISVGYTLTPSDTTDTVIIESNKPDIVSIENGKAVSKGVGSATITVSCGSQSATISVTSTMTMQRNFKGEKYLVKVSGTPDYCAESSGAYWGYCGAETSWGSGRYISTSSQPYIPVYKLPTGCASVKVNLPNIYKSYVLFFDSTHGPNELIAKLVQGTGTGDAVAGTRIVDVPEGADSFCVCYRTNDVTFNATLFDSYDVEFIGA